MPDPSGPPLAEHAARLLPRIDAALALFTQFPAGCPARLAEAMRYSLLAPGKRLRPMLVLLAAEACGGTMEKAMPAACAVEMVHAYSLIHDDLPAMDDDDLRRGRPTCHKAFGEATAILAGDGLLALAFEVLAKNIDPPGVAAACCATLAEAAGPCQLVGGQADDLAAETNRMEGELSSLESIHSRKTGAMIRAALRLGGLTAGADAAGLAALDEYGWRLGLAFQITDDLLDVHGDEVATGKRVGKDAQKGKLTFPGLLGVDQSAARASQLIAEAKAAIALFGRRMGGLESLAREIVGRTR
jgi:geranylgeranyl diphosphate synthase, type II